MLDATGVRGVRGRSGEAGGRPDSSDLDWRVLYETHAPLVRHHAARLVDASLVDDIVQETFLRAFRNRRSIRPDQPLGPWSSVIARRAAIDLVRRREVHDRVSTQVPIAPIAPEPIEDDYFNAVRSAGIRQVFGELNDRHRRVLAGAVLDAVAGEPKDVLDSSTRSVLARARRRFRAQYIELTEQTGVFGSLVLAVRRKGAVTRDALVRAESWLQAGMPILIAACAGVSLLGSALPPSVAANAAEPTRAQSSGESAARGAGEGAPAVSTLASERNAAGNPHRADFDPQSPRDPSPASPPVARTSVDWHAGRNGDRAGIYVFQHIETDVADSRHNFAFNIYCDGGMSGAALCRLFDQVPEAADTTTSAWTKPAEERT